MNYILSIIGFGFLFGIGLGLAYILFQISFLILRQLYISYIIKKSSKKTTNAYKANPPNGMEFGKF